MNLTRLSFDKVFFHQDRLAELFANGDCFPLQGIFGITNACNHRCVWCYPMYIGKSRETTYFVDTKRFNDFLTECRSRGLKSYMMVGSGEPTLHKGFCDILAHSKEIGLEVGVYTNGYRLSDPKILDAVLSACTYVRISLDAGSAATHERLHGVKDHFPAIIENLQALVKARKGPFPTIGVQIATSGENSHELSLLAGLCRDIGVDYLSIKPVYADIYAKTLPEKQYNLRKLQGMMSEAESFSNDAFKVYAKYEQFEDALISPTNDGRDYHLCQGTPFILFADGDGSVYICPNRTVKFGNFLEQSISEIWASAMRREVLASVDLKECPSGCHLHPLNKLLWSIKHPDPQLHPNFL